MNRGPRFPLYIVSKGRWESRLTAKALESMNLFYYVVIEAQEFEKYASVIDSKKLLILDKKYQDEYDTCDLLGNTKSKGPGAARNFAWDHSIKNGFSHHWVMDDNIYQFCLWKNNQKVRTTNPSFWRAMEDFVLRYKNIAMAGPNYFMFANNRAAHKMPPFVLNTRIYSCNLIKNDVPFRWRGRYNEDTDLSLNMLKDGYCTVQFNMFLQLKAPTQTIKGGNDKDFYSKEGTLPKSQMQVQLHPDVSELVFRFGRWHHYVDYTPFKKNKLVIDPTFKLPKTDYGFTLKRQ